jgi:hypothetical protein
MKPYMPPRRALYAIPLGLCLPLSALLACAHGGAETSSTPAAAKAKPVIPPGCEALITGDYQHEDDPSYRYKAEDNGSLLLLRPYRINEDGTPGEMGAGKPQDMLLELHREPEGFVGVFRMTEVTGDVDGGVRCQALFAAKVLACAPTKLTLEVEQEYAMDQACKRVDTGGADVADHVLVKIPARATPSP